jgi:hypothetical protein
LGQTSPDLTILAGAPARLTQEQFRHAGMDDPHDIMSALSSLAQSRNRGGSSAHDDVNEKKNRQTQPGTDVNVAHPRPQRFRSRVVEAEGS